MKRILISLCAMFFTVSTAFAYDATVNYKQQYPELVAGWYVKASPTKGGPYSNVTDCGKVPLKSDSSYDCKVSGYTANPVYVVVIPYDSSKKELAQSAEASLSVTVPAPTDVKIVVTITTISRLTSRGNVIADTSIKKTSVPVGAIVKEGTSSYRNKSGQYVTKTVLIFG